MRPSQMLRGLFAMLVVFVQSPASAQQVQQGGQRPPMAPVFNPPGAAAQPTGLRSVGEAFTAAAPRAGMFTVRYEPGVLRDSIGSVGAVLIEGFPLTPGLRVDLEVERFWVTAPGAKFVAGDPVRGADRELEFDPAQVVLLRGRVKGEQASHVYLGLSPWVSNGWIDLGHGRGRYGVGSRTAGGGQLPDGHLHVFAATGGTLRNPVPYCEVLELEPAGKRGDGPDGPEAQPVRGLRQLELAIETDHHFYLLFNDEQATAAYVVQMYGAMSDVYVRDINVRVDLTYARIWPTGNVPFAVGLSGFSSWWGSNMQSVHRDVAQMFSGRGDMPGGVAYLNAICQGYGFCGNALGFFADAESSGVYTYDPMVAAHELGHNCGTHHTDTYGIDNCNLTTPTPRRGTIMSYCNQTVSGTLANVDMRFHKIPQQMMLQYLATRPCVVADCNQNGVADNIDIASLTSLDLNANGIPDECEDCNGNNQLDSIDITLGVSMDVNANGIPDECEPDCNNNQIPDRMDITQGTSQDLYGDWKPDECDADRNTNGVSDYNEIMANMTLDRNRNAILDSAEDCDEDGIPDLVELEGAWNVWAIANLQGRIREYHSLVGVLMNSGPTGALNNPQDLIITPDRRILVASAGTNSVVEFDREGALVGPLVSSGSGGLNFPSALAIAPWGNLLVCSQNTNSVLEYDLQSGAFVRAFVPAVSGGLSAPTALAFGPGGNLFVAGNDNRVREYDGGTGEFVRTFVAQGSGGLSGPRGMAWKPDGRLLVTSYNTDQVLEYDGSTGAFIRPLLVTGLPVDGPRTVRIGPTDGLVYVSRFLGATDTHVTRAWIFIFDPVLGNFMRAHTQSPDSMLSAVTGFDFMPGDAKDCNKNRLPDECDIASGRSRDHNFNGKPDECENFCYANCDLSTQDPILNVADFSCFLQKFAAGVPYANCDGSTVEPVLNVADFACFLGRFASGCP